MTTLNTLPIQLDKLDYLQGPQILEREAALWAEILTTKADETARQARLRQVAQRIHHRASLITGRISG